ncbi:hypothetical protein, variant 1 [Aphanomyces invadans]|uniref:Inward rectifier potassium channel C-terminal domain-containing protein n=1 Tax=Aphanomyces invadans TaxID=157072 RepID=A0A024UAX2_9STRA|nr:hypothetical protein H310_04866 [Aphanomyces invadans]XP_008867619.1 hypothetical protein, variant 1 [Aphanomyces invadans]ETW03389.1 hypothetical protein H310_04866 [Aphanomyces invadans]ETW03390.1 hypothetical protein, variant 1 [Aphanomyces invadans]|eukprot:XP_008867618.1 hypothetical protein H310_04866 [Aphanomyces invadans]
MVSKKRFQFQKSAVADIHASKEDIPILSAPWHSSWIFDWPGVDIHYHGDGSANPNFFRRRALADREEHNFLPRLKTINNPRKQYKDIIYILLNMRWVPFGILYAVVYFAMCAVFALLLTACDDFGDYSDFRSNFDLSFQTMATIGFGVLFPKSRCSNYVITVEAIVSLLLTAALSGLVFAKFAKPKAKMAFSVVCCVQPYGKDKLALVFRVANATRSTDVTTDVVMDATFNLHLMRIEKSLGAAGKLVMRQYPLKLLQSNFISFRMAVALVHVIDAESPLHGLTEDTLKMSEMIFQLSMTGVDSTLQDTVIERRMYTIDMVQWGQKFAEMLHFDETTMVVSVDFAKLSQIVPAPIVVAKVRNHRGEGHHNSAPTTRPGLCHAHTTDQLCKPTPKMTWSSSQRAIRVKEGDVSTPTGNMEPLFEPLLQPSVGTQRILRKRRPSSSMGGLTADQLVHLHQQLAGDVMLPVSIPPSGDVHDLLRQSDDYALERAEDRLLSRSMSAGSDRSIEITNTPRFVRVHAKNVPVSYSFLSFYYTALHMKWPRILLMILGSSVVVNVAFGLLYYMNYDQLVVHPDVANGSHPFEIAVYMSFHTWATIGYGTVAPSPDHYINNVWVAVESVLSLVFITIFTGIAWSKFARPRAHIHFSEKIVLSTYHGHRCLLLRAANTRHHGDIRESHFRLGVVLTNLKTGLRQMQDVPLVISQWPSILLPVTLVHVIDENSPFFQFQTPDDLSAYRVSVIALFTGLDSTFAENVYARKMYFWDNFVMSKHFENTVDFTPDSVTIDYNKFDTLVDDDVPFHLHV